MRFALLLCLVVVVVTSRSVTEVSHKKYCLKFSTFAAIYSIDVNVLCFFFYINVKPPFRSCPLDGEISIQHVIPHNVDDIV